MFRLLLPAAVAACMLIVVPAAGGQAPAAKVAGAAAEREPRLATMTQEAVRFWNDPLSHCAGGVQLELGDASSAPTPDAWAWAEVGGCQLWVNTANRKAWPLRASNLMPWCNIVAHEYGHLRGLEHSRDDDDIMHAIVPMASPGCEHWDAVGSRRAGESDGSGSANAGRPARRRAKRCSTAKRSAGRSVKRSAKRVRASSCTSSRKR